MTFTTDDLLGAMLGITYVTNSKGIISAVGQPTWGEFASKNNGETIANGASVVSRQILDFVEGEETKSAYRQYMQALKDVEAELIEFDFRCDAPSTWREMRMTISPICSRGAFQGYLFQIITLGERARPPLKLFDTDWVKRMLTSDKCLPLISLCSYCHKVRMHSADEENTVSWVEVEEYYKSGGTSETRISHGICPYCKKTKVDPKINQWKKRSNRKSVR